MNNISIITVSFNAIHDLKKTVSSVVCGFSNYKGNIEYIIIDGDSNDGTKNYLNNLEFHLGTLKYTSEPDAGIYDAMNKGLDLVADTSEYVIFINAGDLFFSSVGDTLSAVHLVSDIHVFNISSKDEFGNEVIIRKGRHVSEIMVWPSYPHQSTFIKTSWHKKNKYNTQYKILADYAFFSLSYTKGVSIVMESTCIATFMQGGVSNSPKQAALFVHEFKAIQKKFFGKVHYSILLGMRVKWYIRRFPKLEIIIRRLFLK